MPRWDMLLVGAAIAGGVMLIENGHRVDTGASDDDVVASAPADCPAVYAVNRERMSPANGGDRREEAAAAMRSRCTER